MINYDKTSLFIVYTSYKRNSCPLCYIHKYYLGGDVIGISTCFEKVIKGGIGIFTGIGCDSYSLLQINNAPVLNE